MKKYNLTHIECGSIPFLTKAVKTSKVAKKYTKNNQIAYFNGLRVIQNPNMPPQVVAIVDKDGKYLSAFNLVV